MIAQIAGTVLEATASMVVVDVHGLGFELGVSNTTAATLPAVGQNVHLYTRFIVREDAMTLFGFANAEERSMFDKLVAVSGVGAKLALAVLSTFNPAQLYQVVMADDDVSMSKVSGVGKKTAQRLILELKSAFAKEPHLAGLSTGEDAVPVVSGQASESAAADDARAALLSMGFTSTEVDLALSGYDCSNKQVEEILSSALKRLGMEA